MNFNFTKTKTIISIIIGLAIGLYLSIQMWCVGTPRCGGYYTPFTQALVVLKNLFGWIWFLSASLIVFIIIYVIWSLIQRKGVRKK